MISISAEGDLKEWADRKIRTLKKYMTAAALDAALSTRDDLRAQAKSFMGRGSGAGRGQDPIKSISAIVYPKVGSSVGAAGEVRLGARWWRAHIEGPEVIKAASGRWLAIPLPAAIDMKLDRSMSKGGLAGARLMKRSSIPEGLRFVPFDGGRRALLVMDSRVSRGGRLLKVKEGRKTARGASVPLFLLVRSVRLPKRIDLKKAERDGYRRYIRSVEGALDALEQA